MRTLFSSVFLFLLVTTALFSQPASVEEKQKIDYWLRHYNLDLDSPEYRFAQSIFHALAQVADKPVGVLPQLYIFSDLQISQVFSLRDGSILLPSELIKFCQQKPRYAEARLAFIMGHELKHVVKGDYWKADQIISFVSNASEPKPLDTLLTERLDALKRYIELRESFELEADEYGLLYASLAGYEVASIISPSENFLVEFYSRCRLDLRGTVGSNSVISRVARMREQFRQILDHLVLFKYSIQLYAISEYNPAIDLLQRFLARYPSKEVFNNLGLCYLQKAMHYYRKWKETDGQSSDPFLTYRLSVKIDPSIHALEELIRLKGEPTTISHQASTLFIESIEKAISLFEEAKSRDTSYELLYNNLGSAYLLKNEIDFAKGNFKKALSLNPYNTDAYNNLAVAYILEKNIRDAVTNFLASLSRSEEVPEALYNLAHLSLSEGRIQEAREYFEKYLKVDSTSYYANRVRQILGKQLVSKENSATIEKINNLRLDELAAFIPTNGDSFDTPFAQVNVFTDSTHGVQFLNYQYKYSPKQIVIANATSNYHGSTSRGIQVNDPLEKIFANYQGPYRRVAMPFAEILIYKDFGIGFEIKEGKVQSWFLFATMQ